jgi:HNH endonuclease
MAISTRLRYEVLRRDLFTCRYCGASAPWAVLEMDHVTPRKLGGRDVLENLVTACKPCNNGKFAFAPQWWLVAEIGEATREWRGEDTFEPDEDDYAELESYLDALSALGALSAAEALSWVAKSFAAAGTYRPTCSEMIICAGSMARRAARDADAAPAPDDGGKARD